MCNNGVCFVLFSVFVVVADADANVDIEMQAKQIIGDGGVGETLAIKEQGNVSFCEME